MDTNRRVLQIVGKMLGQSLDSRLGSIVGGIARRIGNALLGSSHHDGSRLILRLQHGDEGVQAVDHTEEVDIQNLEEI
jgi:hypothetical protein